MVHVDQAVARLSADEARLIRDALAGAAAAAAGEPWEHLFADLVDREPTLPDHLARGA
jgi:hydrogenase expression/formation protein HypC